MYQPHGGGGVCLLAQRGESKADSGKIPKRVRDGWGGQGEGQMISRQGTVDQGPCSTRRRLEKPPASRHRKQGDGSYRNSNGSFFGAGK